MCKEISLFFPRKIFETSNFLIFFQSHVRIRLSACDVTIQNSLTLITSERKQEKK